MPSMLPPVLGGGVLRYSGAVGVGICPGWSEAAGCCVLSAKGRGDREHGGDLLGGASSMVGAGACAWQEDVTRRHRVRS